MDPAPGVNWLLVIAVIVWPLVYMVGCILILNFVWDHWGRVRWQRLVRYVLWIAVNAPIADTDADFWLTPPPIPHSRHRR